MALPTPCANQLQDQPLKSTKKLQAEGIASPPGKTVFLGAATEGAIFADPQKGAGFRDVIDGSSNTAMIVIASPTIAVEWTKPADYNPAGGPPASLFPYSTPQGIMHPVALCDGAVFNLNPATVQKEDWKNIFNAKDGNIVDFR